MSSLWDQSKKTWAGIPRRIRWLLCFPFAAMVGSVVDPHFKIAELARLPPGSIVIIVCILAILTVLGMAHLSIHKPTTTESRRKLEGLLGIQMEKGEDLLRRSGPKPGKEWEGSAISWIRETEGLIELSVGKGRSQVFMGDSGKMVFAETGHQGNLRHRLNNIAQLIRDLPQISISEEFVNRYGS